MEGSETTEPCHLYRVKNCYKLCSFWRFVDTRPIVRPRLRTHFADILNSQLMYTVQLLIIKGGLTLILRSHFQKHGFFCGFTFQISVPSSIALFRSLKVLHTVRTKRRVYSGGTESFVGISRQKQYLRPLCGTICKATATVTLSINR